MELNLELMELIELMYLVDIDLNCILSWLFTEAISERTCVYYKVGDQFINQTQMIHLLIQLFVN